MLLADTTNKNKQKITKHQNYYIVIIKKKLGGGEKSTPKHILSIFGGRRVRKRIVSPDTR